MAEEQSDQTQTDDTGGSSKGLSPLMMMVGVVVVAAIAGVGASLVLGTSPQSAPAEVPDDLLSEYSDADDGDGTYVYVEFEPITTNLDEKRLSRHIQFKPLLAISSKPEELVKKAQDDIAAKQAELSSWLTIYFTGCTLDDVRGSGNVNRILREIREEFNQRLWPDKKPLIHHVLLKDFKVQ